MRVGRAIDNDIVLNDPYVSSYHLEAWMEDGRLVVEDLDSRNGTFLNGQRITRAMVAPTAVLALGPNVTLPAGQILAQLTAAPQPSLFIRRLTELEYLLAGQGLGRIVGKERKVILRDVDVSVRRGQFIAIAGASGAGKSTLMKVLNGYTPPDTGTLTVARDRYGQEEIGYVPQDDIIHRELPLREAIVLSALLRYPPETPREVVERRAGEVLTELGLSEHANTPVARLSGGQRKRASVALELMTKPRLLLLDEPTSGLDPASDRRLIRLLRALADSGIGILLITHTTTNIAACDTVAFLAPGGYLVFYGTPEEAKAYFGTTNLEEVYEKLESEGRPEEWRQRFVASPYYRRLRGDVDDGLRQLAGAAGPTQPPPYPDADLVKWQLKGLATRYFRTVLGDRRNFLILLAQLPVLVLLARLIFTGDVLTRIDRLSVFAPLNPQDVGSSRNGINLLFLCAATLVWCGTINAAREICKEAPIWERESHIGVRPLPYVLSKMLVLGGLCLAQTLTLAVLLFALWEVPGGAGAFLGIILAGFLAALSAVAVGLLISAAVPTPDRAMALAPLAMIPQIMFGGGLIALSELGTARVLSMLFSARWAFEALGRLTERTHYVAEFTQPQLGQRNPYYGQFDGPWIVPVLALAVLTVVFTAAAVWLVTRRSAVPRPARGAAVGQQVVLRT